VDLEALSVAGTSDLHVAVLIVVIQKYVAQFIQENSGHWTLSYSLLISARKGYLGNMAFISTDRVTSGMDREK
jgi:hypothetical protein